jgi:hypothetical protein
MSSNVAVVGVAHVWPLMLEGGVIGQEEKELLYRPLILYLAARNNLIDWKKKTTLPISCKFSDAPSIIGSVETIQRRFRIQRTFQPHPHLIQHHRNG